MQIQYLLHVDFVLYSVESCGVHLEKPLRVQPYWGYSHWGGLVREQWSTPVPAFEFGRNEG